jgi:hypothetical protein
MQRYNLATFASQGEPLADITGIIRDLEQQRNAIDTALSALRELTSSVTTASNAGIGATPGDAPRKRQMSAAGRKRIAEATRRRWAEKRAAEKSVAFAKNIAAAKSTGKKTAAVKKTAASKKTAGGKKTATGKKDAAGSPSAA